MKAPRLLLARGLPTPVEALPGRKGPGNRQIWIKRDDLAGGRYPGGGAWRKLEYIFAEVQANGARSVVTWGAENSAYCQAVSLASRDLGIECTIVIETDEPAAGHPLEDDDCATTLNGANLLYVKPNAGEKRARTVFEKAWEQGRRPYLIPFGGTTPAGVLGYWQAFDEFELQKKEAGSIVIPIETGCSLAGLVIGAKMSSWPGRILGVTTRQPQESDKMRIAIMANAGFSFLNSSKKINAEEIHLVPSEALGRKRILEENESAFIEIGIDNVSAIIEDMSRADLLDAKEDILFWNTGFKT